MNIGCPKEIKNNENRVAITPKVVLELSKLGHDVFIEKNAGLGSGFSNDDYKLSNAKILNNSKEVFEAASLILKVKEPFGDELNYLNKNHIIFTFLHLASDIELTQRLINSNCTAIAYETITDLNGTLPILLPMSEIAGSLAPHFGANLLLKNNGGKGVLMGGATGVQPAKVVVIGGGVSGTEAARVSLGMGAEVIIFDKSISRLKHLNDLFQGKVSCLNIIDSNFQKIISDSDMIIGAVLIPGQKPPLLIDIDTLNYLKPKTVLVDIAIDQGGCFESSRPTTHEKSTFIYKNIIHYCVSNIPGCVPNTATNALCNTTFPYIKLIAEKGWKFACKKNHFVKDGINIYKGKIVNKNIAKSFGLNFENIENFM